MSIQVFNPLKYNFVGALENRNSTTNVEEVKGRIISPEFERKST